MSDSHFPEDMILAAVREAVDRALENGTVIRVRDHARVIAAASGCDVSEEDGIAAMLMQVAVQRGALIEFQKHPSERVAEAWEERLDSPRA